MQETNHLTLEIYHESGDRGVAERAAEALKRLVGELGPDLVLDLHVMEAFAVGRSTSPGSPTTCDPSMTCATRP
jgi:hypothetical protein